MKIGSLPFGNSAPIRIQSMTDTDTADIDATVSQVLELANAGSELVRITVDSPASAKAVPQILEKVRKETNIPIIGDFHFNGHILLEKYPQMAAFLDKWRINPGNVGKGEKRDENFEKILLLAKKHKKPIRIGVNGGSIDPDVLQREMDAPENAGKSSDTVFVGAMVKSALTSAAFAEKMGIDPQNIVLSVKHSSVPIMIAAYRDLSKKSQYSLHVGLTEAGGGVQGIVASSIALGTLLQEGIGDTIRVSITPQKGESRTKEVKVCQQILQSLGLRSFSPKVVSCPGCGRTTGNTFADMAQRISTALEKKAPQWSKKYKKFPSLHIAVMGCVVNGVGEAQNADIGLFFPGKGEGKNATIMTQNQKKNITASSIDEIEILFLREVEEFLQNQ